MTAPTFEMSETDYNTKPVASAPARPDFPHDRRDLEQGHGHPPNYSHFPLPSTIQSPPKKSAGNRYLLIGLGIALVFLLCVVVGGVVYHLTPSHKPIPAPQTFTNCISCEILEKVMDKSGKALNLEEVDLKRENGRLLCCIKTTSKSDDLLEMLLREASRSSSLGQNQPKAAEDNTSQDVSRPPLHVAPPATRPTPEPARRRNKAAALVGIEHSIPKVSGVYVLKEWGDQARYPVTFIREEIHYTKHTGKFKLPRDGLYCINVHLGIANYNRTDILFGQKLMRTNPHWPRTPAEELASDREKILVGERKTSSVSAIFNLRKDDEIYVEVGAAHAVIQDSSVSYLSLILISE